MILHELWIHPTSARGVLISCNVSLCTSINSSAHLHHTPIISRCNLFAGFALNKALQFIRLVCALTCVMCCWISPGGGLCTLGCILTIHASRTQIAIWLCALSLQLCGGVQIQRWPPRIHIHWFLVVFHVLWTFACWFQVCKHSTQQQLNYAHSEGWIQPCSGVEIQFNEVKAKSCGWLLKDCCVVSWIILFCQKRLLIFHPVSLNYFRKLLSERV